MPRYTGKNKVTGETVSFDWDGDKPPTTTDITRISDQQRQARIALKEAAVKSDSKSVGERLTEGAKFGWNDSSGLMKPVGAIAGALAGVGPDISTPTRALGLDQPWHPLDSASQAVSGVKQIISGQGPEQNPRTAGLSKTVHGVIGAVGPPLTALGYATAPIPMAAGMLAGNAASYGVKKGIETVAPDTSPEVTDLASTGAGLVVGGLAGHGASRMMPKANPYIPEQPPEPSTGLQAPKKVYGRWETPGGENVGTIVNLGPRQLPPGRPEAPFTPQGPRAPAGELPPAPEPSPVPQFNQGDRSTLPAARPQAQLPEHGEPIPPPVVNYGRPPIQLPPAGTAASEPLTIPPPTPINRAITQLPTVSRYSRVPLTPLQMQIPKGPGPEGTDVSMFHGIPEGLPPADAPRPALGPSEVPTTESAAPAPIPQQTPPKPLAPPIQVPPQPQAPQVPVQAPIPQGQVPQVPPPQIPPPAPRAYTPPAPPMGPVSNPIDPMAIARAAMAKRQAPQAPPDVAPIQPPAQPAPQAPTPEPTAPEPFNLEAELAKAQAENKALKAKATPTTPPKEAPLQVDSGVLNTVSPPTPPQNTPPAVQAPTSAMDIAKAAMGKIPDVQAPGAKVEPTKTTPPEAETPMLSPEQANAAKLNNNVLDFLKKRQNVTIDQVQRQFGVPADKARVLLQGMEKRGLISSKAGKYNYNKMSGEDTKPEEVEPGVTPQGAPQAEKPPDTSQLSPHRQKRIGDLQQQIGQAEDEGDTGTADLLRDHLQTEEKYARIEKGNNPEAKQQLSSLDFLYDNINRLEDKETSGELTDKETAELGKLYKNANRLETILNTFMKDEGGQQGGEQPGPKRGFFARRTFIRNVENPGRATTDTVPRPKDVNRGLSELMSTNKILRESGIKGAVEIGERTPQIEDLKHKFVGTYERRAVPLIKGLSKPERMEVGDILDRFQDPETARGYSPKSIQAAIGVRDLLDEIYNMLPKGANKGKDVGYTKGYLTHIKSTLESNSDFAGVFEDLYKYHTGVVKSFKDLFTRQDSPIKPEERPMGQYGVGDPHSPYTEQRTGALMDVERDIKRVLPVYIESAAKAIYDKPWIEKAKKHLNEINQTSAKELATAYLRNYARYDAYPGLENAWDTVTGRMMRITGRSLLAFDTRLWTLHAARLASNIYPELPGKYMAEGIKQFSKNPSKAYTDMGRLGLMNIRPWMFKTTMEKVDSVGAAFSAFDMVPDAIAYHGFKKMYQDKGLDPATASNMAINKTKEVSLRVTPARAARIFYRDLGYFKPFTQFKQQVFKIAEQYGTAPLDAIQKHDYNRLARYIIGAGSMIAAYDKLKISTWHLNPFTVLPQRAAAYEKFGGVIHGTYNSLKAFKEGDADKGEKILKKTLEDAGLLITPGGLSLKHQIEKGPSMFEAEPATRRGSSSPRLPRLE